MRFKSLASPLALIIALGVTGAAVAQDTDAVEKWWTVEDGAMMIDGVSLTPEQAEYVQAYCDTLQEEYESDIVSDDDSEMDAPDLADTPTSMINFDLSLLIRDDCIDAGFIEE